MNYVHVLKFTGNNTKSWEAKEVERDLQSLCLRRLVLSGTCLVICGNPRKLATFPH